MLKFRQFLKLSYKIIFIFIVFTIILVNTNLISAPFDAKNISSWKQDFKQFEKMDYNSKNSAWNQALDKEKKDFLDSYADYKKKGLKVEGLESKDLTWNKKGLTNGKAYVDFDSLRESLIKISYDTNKKEFTYTFQAKDGKKLDFTFDKGTHNAEGLHETGFGSKNKVSVNTNTGKIVYENGKYTISDGAILKVDSDEGVVYFSENKDIPEAQRGKTSVELKDGGIVHENAKASVQKAQIEKNWLRSTTKRELEKTFSAEFLSASKPVNLFLDGSQHSGYKGAYQQLDAAENSIKMDSKDSYSAVRIWSDFNSVKANGEQAYVINGEATLLLKDGKVYNADPSKTRGFYNIDEVSNLLNTDPNSVGNIYAWSKYKDSPYADLFDAKGRLSEMIANPTISVLPSSKRGQSASSPVYVNYNKEFEEGYFKGTEEERIKAIAADPNTVVTMRFARNVPGQYLAAEILDNMGSAGKNIKNIDSDMISNSLIFLSNYDPQLNMGSLTPEQVAALPSANRLLYELSKTYGGNIYIPDRLREARKIGGTVSSGGIYQIDYAKDGIYVNGQKIESVNLATSSSLDYAMSSKLINWRNNPSSDLKLSEKFQSYCFDGCGLRGKISAGMSALEFGRAKNNEMEAKVQAYQSSGKLP